MLLILFLQVVGLIFTQSAMEYYEEAFSLVFDLTSKKISPDLWKVLEMIYQVSRVGFGGFFYLLTEFNSRVFHSRCLRRMPLIISPT